MDPLAGYAGPDKAAHPGVNGEQVPCLLLARVAPDQVLLKLVQGFRPTHVLQGDGDREDGAPWGAAGAAQDEMTALDVEDVAYDKPARGKLQNHRTGRGVGGGYGLENCGGVVFVIVSDRTEVSDVERRRWVGRRLLTPVVSGVREVRQVGVSERRVGQDRGCPSFTRGRRPDQRGRRTQGHDGKRGKPDACDHRLH